jgi:hypothetical protein
MTKINVDEILLKHCTTKTNDYGTHFSSINKSQCKQAMKEFAEQLLLMAAENAEGIVMGQGDTWVEIDKESITSVINQIKF